jgi:hypothetical protein
MAISKAKLHAILRPLAGLKMIDRAEADVLPLAVTACTQAPRVRRKEQAEDVAVPRAKQLRRHPDWPGGCERSKFHE